MNLLRMSFVVMALGLSASLAGAGDADWPQWRGPNRDGRSGETGLLPKWPEQGPKLRWTFRDAGVGYSEFAIVDGKAYSQGAKGEESFAFALDMKTGERLWVTPSLSGKLLNNWGDGPRGAIAVDGDRLYLLTGVGELACLDRGTGAKRWSKNLIKDFNGGQPNWGYCESPLVDGDRVLATPGGANFMVALDKMTGEKIASSTGLEDGAQYASIGVAEVPGQKMYVTMSNQGVVGLAASDLHFLWRYEKTANKTAVIPTPIVSGEYVYSTSGYGTGCGLVKLEAVGDGVSAKEEYFSKAMKNHHGGVILDQGHVFGFSDGAGWMCQDFKTGAIVWQEKRKLGKGSIVYADGKFILYGEDEGSVVMIDASTTGWNELGRFTLPETTKLERQSGKIWTHPVVAEGALLLRDQDLVFCYEIK